MILDEFVVVKKKSFTKRSKQTKKRYSPLFLYALYFLWQVPGAFAFKSYLSFPFCVPSVGLVPTSC